MGRSKQAKNATDIKVRLIHLGWSIAKLGRQMNPPRPRSTVSQAIHHPRFPKVRQQIERELWP
jgi:hypothetical protein